MYKFEKMGELLDFDPTPLVLTANALEDPAKTPEAVAAITAADERDFNEFQKAGMLAALGEDSLSLDMLEAAFEARISNLPYINFQIHFERLRPDPRFQDILRRINLDNYQAGTEFESQQSP